MLPDHQKRPNIANMINRAGEKYKERMAPLVRLDENELLANVSRRLSLHDYGDDYFREGLRRLIDSVNNDVALTFLGQVLQRTAIERSLENRLRFTEFKKKRPDVFIKNINPPFIVLGLPRSGTTFFHRLLAQDPKNRGLCFWELIHPIPPIHQKDYRKIIAKIEYNIFRMLTIKFDHIHMIRDTEYEECIFLLTLTFQSLAYWVFAPVYNYMEWCMRGDQLKCYDEYLQLLKIFQNETPDRRLTLKAPAHTGYLTVIKRLIPDVVLIQTHRHPADVCNSINSLVYWAHANVVKRMDVRKTSEFNVKMLAYGIDRNLFARKYHGVDVHDIWYEELLSDPLSVVKRLYVKHGIELSRDAEEKMKIFIKANTQHKHGNHKYCADDFGMNKQEINEKFEKYMKQFGYSPG